MWVSLLWIYALGSSMMDLGGDVMDESSWKIASSVEAPNLCGSATPCSISSWWLELFAYGFVFQLDTIITSSF
jgi:hypothetical protein